jgi:hypothetical protein
MHAAGVEYVHENYKYLGGVTSIMSWLWARITNSLDKLYNTRRWKLTEIVSFSCPSYENVRVPLHTYKMKQYSKQDKCDFTE